MVKGRALQAAELQWTEVGPATGLHQPDTAWGRALPSLLSQQNSHSTQLVTNIKQRTQLSQVGGHFCTERVHGSGPAPAPQEEK